MQADRKLDTTFPLYFHSMHSEQVTYNKITTLLSLLSYNARKEEGK
jgi:hypothetical protein